MGQIYSIIISRIRNYSQKNSKRIPGWKRVRVCDLPFEIALVPVGWKVVDVAPIFEKQLTE